MEMFTYDVNLNELTEEHSDTLCQINVVLLVAACCMHASF